MYDVHDYAFRSGPLLGCMTTTIRVTHGFHACKYISQMTPRCFGPVVTDEQKARLSVQVVAGVADSVYRGQVQVPKYWPQKSTPSINHSRA